MTNLIGIAIVIVFSIYAISRLKSIAGNDSNPEADHTSRDVRLKAAAFYLLIILALAAYFVISYLSFISRP